MASFQKLSPALTLPSPAIHYSLDGATLEQQASNSVLLRLCAILRTTVSFPK